MSATHGRSLSKSGRRYVDTPHAWPKVRRFGAVLAGLALGVMLGSTALLADDPAPPPASEPAAATTTPESVPLVESPALTPVAPAPLAARVTGAEVPVAPPPPAGTPSPPTLDEGPPALADLSGWLDYRRRHHIAALPMEARLFYRRGIIAHDSGNPAEAARLVRGAAELDPSYVAPHLTLASWTLLGEPSQTLLHYGTVLELARQNFLLQLALAANAIYSVLQALFFGFLATGLMILLIRQAELRHLLREPLTRILSPGSANAWSWAMLALPFFLGFGPALPCVVLLGLVFPLLSVRERFVFFVLVAGLAGLPWITGSLDRLTLPLDEARGPLYGVALVETEPANTTRAASIGALAVAHPDNPFMQFAAGWTARRGGDLRGAEAAYRRSLKIWPTDDRVMNNLGNALLMQSRADEALDLFRKATASNPTNAAAWFNQSQVYTLRYDYRAATDALSRASALNFDMVRTYQAQGAEDGMLTLVDQWIAPARFWKALASGNVPLGGRGALPPQWRARIETRGWPFSIVLVLLTALAAWTGSRMHRALPLRTCSNCGTVVCRRCSHRRRELALCSACVAVEERAESPEFARVLLHGHRRRSEHRRQLARTALAALVPGLGLLSFHRAFTPLLLVTIAAALLSPMMGSAPPFAFEPRLAVTGGELPMPLVAGAWILIYAWSLLGYFRLVARARLQSSQLSAPVRSRAVQATTHNPTSAAA